MIADAQQTQAHQPEWVKGAGSNSKGAPVVSNWGSAG
jgi:hypothetical protein